MIYFDWHVSQNFVEKRHYSFLNCWHSFGWGWFQVKSKKTKIYLLVKEPIVLNLCVLGYILANLRGNNIVDSFGLGIQISVALKGNGPSLWPN